MNKSVFRLRSSGFTLIELLVVITILGILMSLAVNGAGAIRSQARTAQARNDCTGLSTAIRAFYTDYSRYPVAATKKTDDPFEATDSDSGNKEVMNGLTGKDVEINPRAVQYYENKAAKKGSTDKWVGGFSPEGGLFDPWGFTYGICVDADFDGTLKYAGTKLKYYATSLGDTEENVWKQIPGGVGVYSLGKDQCGGEGKKNFAPGILSWY